MVLVQKWPFFQPFFLGNIGQENVFHDILQQKSNFLGFKNTEFKKSKNWNFFKNGHFCNICFLGNTGKENVFYDILERKNAFPGYKNKKFKRSKNSRFSKGFNPWYWSKNGHFSDFFFRQYRPGKCLLRYSRTKKRLSRL